MTTLIMQTYFPRHGISGKRFEPWLQPIAIIEKGNPGVRENLLEVRCEDARKPEDATSPPKWEVARLDDKMGLSVTATEGCLLAWKVKRNNEDGCRVYGDALLFAPGNLWDNEPEGYILSAYLGRAFCLAMAIVVLLLAQDGARAQQRGYFWDGYEWQWHGGGQPTRAHPPGPVYPEGQIREHDMDCQGQYCVDQFHRNGGRPRPLCPSPRGPIPCY